MTVPSPLIVTELAGGPTDISHDERLRRGIIDTSVSRGTAWALTLGFLFIIASVPVTQAVLEQRHDEDSSVIELFRHRPSAERLRQFEKDLGEASYFKSFTQPELQLRLSRYGRVGNKNAVIGHEGWLYYKPGITYLNGPPFLAADALESRRLVAVEAGDEPPAADPLPAIASFAAMLRTRGVELVLVPVPDKAMIQPFELHGRGGGRASSPAPRARGWPAFVARVRALGVVLFDPTPRELRADGPNRFLVQDTHWSPEFMQGVARDLADTLESLPVELGPRGAAPLHDVPMDVSRVGDLVDMLKLPEGQTAFPALRITVRQVRDAADQPWQPDPKAAVLLLGDSFTNVFTAEPMGWGSAAGFAAHLALALDRAVDVIAQNDSGAFATRQALAQELAAGEDRLAGKKVVIWEFASRELAVGDWKHIDWATAPVPKEAR